MQAILGKNNALEVAFRLCEVVDTLNPENTFTPMCAFDSHYIDPTVKKLHLSDQVDFKERASLPFFVFAAVDSKFSNVFLKIYDYDHQTNKATDSDIQALSVLANHGFARLPPIRGNVVRISLPILHLDEPFQNDEA